MSSTYARPSPVETAHPQPVLTGWAFPENFFHLAAPLINLRGFAPDLKRERGDVAYDAAAKLARDASFPTPASLRLYAAAGLDHPKA